jgi:Ca2+-binding RTX toxin-like protein
MIGKGGNDTYIVDDAGDLVIEDSAAGGYDTVNTSVNYSLTTNVEALTATGTGSIALNGNSLNNVITGNSGNNVIDGGIGADTMQGGAGDDVYYVDNIGDVVIDAQGNNTIRSTINYKSAQFVGNVELIGSNNIEVIGNDLANVLRGNTGDNRINGKKGNDVLFGGGGKDSFVFDSSIGTWKTNKKINLDRIQDFTAKQDKLLLDNKIFKKLGKNGKLKADFFEAGKKAGDKNDYLVYDKKKKALYYDKDGSGGSKAVEIIKFDKAISLKASDIWII